MFNKKVNLKRNDEVELFCAKIALILVLAVYITLGSTAYFKVVAIGDSSEVYETGDFRLDATNKYGENYISLEWQAPNSTQAYSYKLWQKSDGVSFEEKSTLQEKEIRALNIYPSIGGNLKTWMETNGAGLGKIKVDQIDILQFNTNPSGYLKQNGEYIYDSIYFGTWDLNNSEDISVSAIDEIEGFIKDGRGVVFGRDTINFPNFMYFTKYLNMNANTNAPGGQLYPWVGSTTIKVINNGDLLKYPWNIPYNTNLSISPSRSRDQLAKGTIWINFVGNYLGPVVNIDGGTNNFYLTTNNNVAMIQTGHSATIDEQRILANLLYFTSQRTTDTYAADRSAVDKQAPDDVKIEVKNVTSEGKCEFLITAEDLGTEYEYYVTATGLKDGQIYESDKIRQTSLSGTKGYIVVKDKNPNTVPKVEKNQLGEVTNINILEGEIQTIDLVNEKGTYLHIIPVDYANNEGEVIHKKIEDTKAPKVEAGKMEERKINENIIVDLKFIDEGDEIISGFKSYKYSIEEGKEEASNWSEAITKAEDSIKIEKEGEYFIHIKAFDNVGNESEDIVLGPYFMEKKEFEIKVKREDKENSSISLGNEEYKMLTKQEGSYDYMIQEEERTGYKKLEVTQMKIDFDKEQNIENVELLNNKEIAEITAYDKNMIEITIKHERKQEEGYNLRIESVEKTNPEEKIEGNKYKITIEGEEGQKLEIKDITDENGKINLSKLQGEGEIKITIEETETAKGYKRNEEKTIITINKNKETGKIEAIAEKSSTNLEAKINVDENAVDITLRNEKKEKANKIKIEIVDKAESEIKLEGLEVEIELPYGLGKIAAKTNEEGIAEIEKIENLGEGDHLYTIRIKNAPSWYIVPEKINVSLSFNKEGELVKGEGISQSVIKTENKKIEKEEKIYSEELIAIGLLKNEKIASQQFKIVKTDSESKGKIGGTIYKIQIRTAESIISIIKTTDNFGEIEIDIPIIEELELVVKELRASAGYVLDSTEKHIKLEKNESGSNMEIRETSEGTTVKEEGTKIILEDTNMKKISNLNERKANINFYLTKKDLEGNLLGKVVFEVIELTTGRSYELITDENGYAELKDFGVPKEGWYEFIIKEKSTVTGFSVPETTIKLDIMYENYEGEMKTAATIVKRGYKYIEDQEYNEYETEGTYQLDITMTIMNEAKPQEAKTIMELIKTNESNQALEGAEFEIKVEYPDSTSIKILGTTNEIGKIIKELGTIEGETKLTIKELSPAPRILKR